MNTQINKKLKRAVRINAITDKATLYTFEEDPSKLTEVGVVSREKAHKWFHGNESRGEVPATDPTTDEMIDAIAAQLKREATAIMENALADENTLQRIYNVALSGAYPYSTKSSVFKLTRPMW